MHQSNLINDDILEYLNQHEKKELLHLLTCGSVDDGKSTLIGRLLHDSKMIYEDHLAAIKSDSKKFNTTDEEFDLALLVDGLQSEREQGITIDVAYRYFSTEKRKFIIADTPGHEQYTRNMATGASTCNLAIILIDARHGVQVQTKRHSFIVSLLGIDQVVVAVNKMDLMDFSKDVFDSIKSEYLEFSKKLNISSIQFVPISALKGDNVVERSEKSSWYDGDTLMEMLEIADVNPRQNTDAFRFPVQYVNRPNLDFRGFSGTVASGEVCVGDEVMVLPSQQKSQVASIVTFDGNLEGAKAGKAITVTLTDEIDISRGNVLVHSQKQAKITRAIEATLIWMAEEPMQLNRQYDFKLSTQSLSGHITNIKHKIDVNSLEHQASESLILNEIAHCQINFNQAAIFEKYTECKNLGAFIIIDRLSNITVGGGIITGSLESQDVNSKVYSDFEVELNTFINKHFPHWNARDIKGIK